MGYHAGHVAVFGMLADKDVAGVVAAIKARVDRWYVATLPGPRGASAAAVAAMLERAGVAPRGDPLRFDDVGRRVRARRGKARAKLIESSFSDRS